MKRKQDKPQKQTTNCPVSRGKKKRTRENNSNSVSDVKSKRLESTRAESNLNSSSHGYDLRRKDPPVFDDADANTNTTSIPERNLQPHVYINDNLRKIKVESDYVPIKTEPNQDIEHDDNDNENENVSSPSSSKKKEETIENLEERIKMHTQKVISLSREKAELEIKKKENERVAKLEERIYSLSREKSEMQKEIDELKLVNGQQQTNINTLKSQVAAQQNQIEELNNKLKSFTENQQSFEKSEDRQVQSSNFPTKVLSRIFDYLDINSLKDSRLVCRLWRNEAGKILLSNFYLVCDGKKRCENALINWLRNSYSIPSTAHKLWAKDKNAQDALQLLRKYPLLGESIRELKCAAYANNNTNVYEILHQLPNLHELEFLLWDNSLLQNWLTEDPSLNNGKSNKLNWLVHKLQTLRICGYMSEEDANHFFRHCQEFSSIRNLEIHVSGKKFIENFTNHSLYNWTITRCILNVEKNYNVELIRRFLMRVSPILQHLKFTFTLGTPEVNSLSFSEPWTDDWIIPLGLNRVETLEIDLDFLNEELVVKSIVTALRLPRLKKLAIDYIPCGRELEEVIQNWNSHESAKGRKLASQSLEELELFPVLGVGYSAPSNPGKIPGTPWPNLKSLKCSSHSPECFDPSVLSELKNLERLELNIAPYDSTFRHIPNKDYKSDFQLRDLKHLMSFHLKVPENEPQYQDFANGFVQSDLKFMKSLQYVQFHRVIVDAESLKTALGPHVPIIFTD